MSASVKYYINAEASLKLESPTLSACLNVFFGQEPVSVKIGAFYQLYEIKHNGWFSVSL